MAPPVGGPVAPPPTPRQPHLVATPPGAVVGSMWVEGAELHYIASDGTEWAETGASQATPPGAVAGSIWSESDWVSYIDGPGVERRISRTSMPAVPSGAIDGSLWLENSAPTHKGEQVQWIGASLARFRWWNGGTA